MKLTGLFSLAFITCCLSFPFSEDTEREKDEQKFLERFLSEEEEVFQDNEQPATKNDEEFERAKEADTPVGDTKGDEERVDEADTPAGDTKGDEERIDEADIPVGGTEGDEELPKEADSLEAEEIAEIPEYPEDEFRLAERLIEEEGTDGSGSGVEPQGTEGDEDI